jgi:hypothetical protein
MTQSCESSSLNSNTPVNDVVFRNLSNTPVELFWLDFFGKGVSYGVIEVDGTMEMNTYMTHPWYCTVKGGQTDEVCRINGDDIYLPHLSDSGQHIDITGRDVEGNDEIVVEAGCCQRSLKDTRCASWEYHLGKCVKLHEKNIGCERNIWVAGAIFNETTQRCEKQKNSDIDDRPGDIGEYLDGLRDLIDREVDDKVNKILAQRQNGDLVCKEWYSPFESVNQQWNTERAAPLDIMPSVDDFNNGMDESMGQLNEAIG